jgi:aromatic-L-amino-acid decarboxylase
MDNQTFRKWGHELIDWVADYYENIEQHPVRSQARPGEIRGRLQPGPPQRAEPMAQLMADFERIVVPGITHWQHPSWFAYFPANTSPPSILAELLTAGLGAQCMVWQTSPAAAELEEHVMGWLRQMLGLPDQLAGVIQDTASTATLCALLTARERVTDWRSNDQGIAPGLVVYTSSEAHSSVEKGAKIAGYGKLGVRRVPTDERFAMLPDLLEQAIERDRNAGLVPACAVATVGTTSSGAIDPLGPIGEICARQGVWLHVDAAWAGTAAILPEKRWILDGIERADSFVFNPHKWMLVNFDCSAYFVRDPGALVRTLEIQPEYLKTGVDTEVKNYRDWGIPLGRRFRALKLWFVIRAYGVEGLKAIVREHIRLAELFADLVAGDDRFEVLAPVELGLTCFRLNDGRPNDELNEINTRLLEELNATGQVFLTHTTLAGAFALRMAIGSRTTEERHVRAAFDLIAKTADRIER